MIGWIGAILMVVFSFTLTPLYGIFGLVLLTIQAYDKRMHNLVVLNLVSIAGLTLHLI